jgi:hypothetical protein
MSEFEKSDSLQPCEVCKGRRYWFDGVHWTCSHCSPPPIENVIRFDLDAPARPN